MEGNQKVIEALNAVLKNELTAINQYFLHARMFGKWGFERLDDYRYKQSIRAMKEADALIVRILFLDSLPNLQELGKPLIGKNVVDCLKNDLKNERERQRPLLVASIALCEQEQDYVSREILEEMLVRSGQERLQLERLDFVEERGPPAAVQMRCDFIQQQYRVWSRFCTRKTRRLAQNQVQNQGFLLAGGTLGRRSVLFGVDDRKIAPVRAGERAPRGGVPLARGGQGAREGGRVVDDTMLIGQEGTGGPHRCGERGAVGVVDLAGSQRFTGGGQFASCRDHRDTNLRANGDGVQSGGCECREVAGSEPEAGRQ